MRSADLYCTTAECACDYTLVVHKTVNGITQE